MTTVFTFYYLYQTPVLGQSLSYSVPLYNEYKDGQLSSPSGGTLFQTETDRGSSDGGKTEAVFATSSASIPFCTLFYQYVFYGKNNGPNKNLGDMTCPIQCNATQYSGLPDGVIVRITPLDGGVRSIDVIQT